jgi:hypothetical protein
MKYSKRKYPKSGEISPEACNVNDENSREGQFGTLPPQTV